MFGKINPPKLEDFGYNFFSDLFWEVVWWQTRWVFSKLLLQEMLDMETKAMYLIYSI